MECYDCKHITNYVEVYENHCLGTSSCDYSEICLSATFAYHVKGTNTTKFEIIKTCYEDGVDPCRDFLEYNYEPVPIDDSIEYDEYCYTCSEPLCNFPAASSA
ncbi:hypothetical protein NQ317_006618 [Molorchus minor]|uniref:Uncharacterized protein n=1 Tax=Molorchus minor TaxID=1323400 RepID=A0ABQ9K1V2_9CUCU|nr:hypothetical protein NQ317_006618 [Molorchus minor]